MGHDPSAKLALRRPAATLDQPKKGGKQRVWAVRYIEATRSDGKSVPSPRGTPGTIVVASSGSAEPLVLLTNQRVTNHTEACDVVRAYLRRWGCELSTRAMKDRNGFGIGLEHTSRSLKLVGQRRLLKIAQLIYLFLAVIQSKTDLVKSLIGARRKDREDHDPVYLLIHRIGDMLRRLLDGVARQAITGRSPARRLSGASAPAKRGFS